MMRKKISLQQFAAPSSAERDAYLEDCVGDIDQWIDGVDDDTSKPRLPTGDLEEQYVQCISCGDLYRYDELSELGFCPGCEEELREVDKK